MTPATFDEVVAFAEAAVTVLASGFTAFAASSTIPNKWAILALGAGALVAGLRRVQALRTTPKP